MYTEVILEEDATTLYVRWEVLPEGGEIERLRELGGPISLALNAENYIDVAGKFHEEIEVEVPIYPHAGQRNFGQGKFTDYESRRSFVERLQQGVVADVANYIFDAEPGSVDVEGHVVRVDAKNAATE